jgi:hypothetical protein
LHQYLRLHLIEKGLNPETTFLERLAKHAGRFEEAAETKKREERDFASRRGGHEWGQFTSRVNSPEPWKLKTSGPGSSKESTTVPKARLESKAATPTTRMGDNTYKGKSQEGQQPRKFEKNLSCTKKDQLRAEGRCFNCEEVGHDSRNCSSLHKAKAPTLSAGSV